MCSATLLLPPPSCPDVCSGLEEACRLGLRGACRQAAVSQSNDAHQPHQPRAHQPHHVHPKPGLSQMSLQVYPRSMTLLVTPPRLPRSTLTVILTPAEASRSAALVNTTTCPCPRYRTIYTPIDPKAISRLRPPAAPDICAAPSRASMNSGPVRGLSTAATRGQVPPAATQGACCIIHTAEVWAARCIACARVPGAGHTLLRSAGHTLLRSAGHTLLRSPLVRHPPLALSVAACTRPGVHACISYAQACSRTWSCTRTMSPAPQGSLPSSRHGGESACM